MNIDPATCAQSSPTIDLKKISAKDIPHVRSTLLKKQKEICPICRRIIANANLDHDHRTGAVRDVLCRNCNRFEGKVATWAATVPLDRIELLLSLLRYWRRHEQNRHNLLHPGKVIGKKRKRRKTNANRTSRKGTRGNGASDR